MDKETYNLALKFNFIGMAILLLGMAVAFSSCERGVFYDKSQKIQDREWSMHKYYAFEVDFPDTIQTYDFYITFRHSVNYPNRNIFFFLRTYYPDSTITRQDTIECFLSDDYGRWLGKDNGNLRDVKMRFATGVNLPVQGKYKFEIRHAARDSILKYVADIGLCITTQDAR